MRATPIILFRICVLSSILLFSATARAQLSVEGMPIKRIEVQSKIRLTGHDIQRLTGLNPGDPYSSSTVRNSLDLLYKTGLFRDIRIEADIEEGGVVVRYLFIERVLISKITIRGNWKFRERELKDRLGIQRNDEFTEDRLKQAVSDLLDFYHNNGYFKAQATADISTAEALNRVQVTIRVREGTPARIGKMEFIGNKVYSDLRLWAVVRSQTGEYYRADQLEKDLLNLESFYQEKGYPQASVGPPIVLYSSESHTVNLTFPIESGARLDVQFEGVRAFAESTLRSMLLFREERSFDDHVIDAGADRLRSHYQSNGYPYVEIRWARAEVPEEDSVQVRFSVKEGPQVCLRSVRMEGNAFLSSGRLMKDSAIRPGLNPLACKPFDSKLIEKDVERMRSLYLEEGFHDVAFERETLLPPDIEDRERARAELKLVIREGTRTLIETVRLQGNEAVAAHELLGRLRIRAGQPYNTAKVREEVDVLRQYYTELGFMYARVSVEDTLSADRSAAGITFRIEEDGRVRIGQVLVQGNTFTHEYVIRRELKIGTGDPYNEDKIQLSRHRLVRLGILRDVQFRPVHPLTSEKKEYTKDMLLSVRERPPKALEFGVGYGEFERLRGFAQLSHINIAGTGRGLTLRGEASSKERKSTLSYLEPWLLNLDVNGRVTALYEIQIRPAYDLTSIGASAGIEKDLTKSLTAMFVYQIEFDDFTDVPEEVLAEEDQGRVNLATLNPSLIFDTRDDPFNPKSGSLNGVAFRLGARRLGSQVQLRKVTLQSHWFFPLTRWLVLAVSARGGIAEKFGESDEVPPSERFFLGGRTTVRGYDQDELGIVGSTISSETGGPTGGKVVLIGNVELRFFLPANLGFVLFHDRGNVWFSPDEKLNLQTIKANDLKSTVGAGLRYNTPVGPLRLDAGYKLDREENLCPDCEEPIEESHYEIHFTLGHAF